MNAVEGRETQLGDAPMAVVCIETLIRVKGPHTRHHPQDRNRVLSCVVASKTPLSTSGFTALEEDVNKPSNYYAKCFR